MISPLDSRVMDANSESMGISIEELMQNAGQALAEAVSDIAGDRRVLFVCGGGNNGGTGTLRHPFWARMWSDCPIPRPRSRESAWSR